MKKTLRKEIFKLRKALTKDDCFSRSEAIMNKLSKRGFLANKRSVHLYYPINNEVNTADLIEQLWAKGIEVIMPRTDIAGKKIDNYRVSSFDQLEKTTFNLLEPKISTAKHTGECDIILIPGLAFDHNLNRLGYGGGFYDRFLANTTALKIAIAYDFQVKESIPSEAHDIKMDFIVTEQRIYE